MRGSGLDIPTHVKYAHPDDPQVFSAERQRLHDKIIKRYLGKVNTDGPDTGERILLSMGGGQGSGKSTFTRWMRGSGLMPGRIATVNLEMISELPEFPQIAQLIGHPHPEKTPTLIREYYHLRNMFVKAALAKGYNVVIDDHCNNPQEDATIVNMAKEAGYLTVLTGMSISPSMYFSDSKTKGLNGHLEWALNSHKDFSGRWLETVSMFDEAFLYQRHAGEPPLVLVGIFQQRTGKTINEMIIDGEKYAIFKGWEEVVTTGKKVEEAFPIRKDEEPEHYWRRMGAGTKGSYKKGEKYTTGEKGPFLNRLEKSSIRIIGLD